MPGLFRLDITVPEESMDAATGLLVRLISFGWEEISLPTGETLFRLHAENPSLLRDVAEQAHALIPDARCEFEEIENRDWTAAWREFFTPVEAGRFVVLPPWLVESYTGKHEPVIIEPKSAFGTGHHATTTLCLTAVSDLIDNSPTPGMNVLDLGTGTGVLGIACAKHGMRVVGTDIDPVAVDNALENIALNGAGGLMRAIPGSTEAVRGEQFDLILANILANPLRELAAEVMDLLKPGGRLILSGILGVQADAVAACYTKLGQPARTDDGDWARLVW